MTDTLTASVADEATARRIASEWHDGQASALYGYASTGHRTAALVAEVTAELRQQRGIRDDQNRQAGNPVRREAAAHAVELSALLAYLTGDDRAGRRDAALALVHLTTDDTDDYDDEGDPTVRRWLAIARSSIDSSYTYSTADDPEEAIRGTLSDEYPEDWTPYYLFDLDATTVDEDGDPTGVQFSADLAWTITIPNTDTEGA